MPSTLGAATRKFYAYFTAILLPFTAILQQFYGRITAELRPWLQQNYSRITAKLRRFYGEITAELQRNYNFFPLNFMRFYYILSDMSTFHL